MHNPSETIERSQGRDYEEAATTPPGASAAELARVLDEYMAALRAGEAPDRDRLVAEHPGLASQLGPCLASINFIHKAGRVEVPDSAAVMLGEFRIVREVRRGGRGVVYEAEQTSLRRRVALKVLRFGVVADDEALRRFQAEDETVARLHHTSIVPVFAVGTERGVSYYAMQFVVTFDIGLIDGDWARILGVEAVKLRRVEGLDARTGREIWHQDAPCWGHPTIAAQTLRVAGNNVVGLVSGRNWMMFDPFTGSPTMPTFDLGRMAIPNINTYVHAIRQPLIADFDGDGSDDLLMLGSVRATTKRTDLQLTAVSPSARRLLWSMTIDVQYPTGDDLGDLSASWPQLVDLDGDGRPEVIVPYLENRLPAALGRSAVGLRVLSGRDGRVRWDHRLMTEQHAEPPHRFVAGSDVDGDAVRDLFAASIRPGPGGSKGSPAGEVVFVDAISGRDGRSIWPWWSQPLLSGTRLSRPLRWWEHGCDGFPMLVVDSGSDERAVRGEARVFILEASTGELLHHGLDDFQPTGSADLDGDGLPELWGTSGDPSNPTAVRRVVSRGKPQQVWKRLGRWLPGRDYDRDGISDLIGPDAAERYEVDAISGRDGRLLWSARPDRSGTPVPRTNGSLFRFVPLAEGVGDLDGDGVPEIALCRERFGDALKADDTARMQLGLDILSGRTGRDLWANPAIPRNRFPTQCSVRDVEAVEIDGRNDLLALIHLEDPRRESWKRRYGSVRLVHLSGVTGQVIATKSVGPWNYLRDSNQPHSYQELPKLRADLDGDGHTEIVFQIPWNLDLDRPSTSRLLAASTAGANVIWNHNCAMKLEDFDVNQANWSRLAAGDLDGEGKAVVVLIDVIDGRPQLERWDFAANTAPRWIWPARGPEDGAITDISPIPRLANLDGSGHKAVVVIADHEKAGRRIVFLDAQGHFMRGRSIESEELGLQIWVHDLDRDGRDEVLFEDRGKLRAVLGDLTTELWASATMAKIKEIRSDSSDKPVIVLESGMAIDGASGKIVWRSEALSNSQLIPSPDPSRPVAVSSSPFETTASLAMPAETTGAKLAPADEIAAAKSVERDPRVIRPLPWVIGSPGGLREEHRRYIAWIPIFAIAAGLYSLVVLVVPVITLRKMSQRATKLKHLFIFPISVAVACGCYRLAPSEFWANRLGLGFQPPAPGLIVALAIIGLPFPAIVTAFVRALRRRGWQSLPASVALYAAGCLIAAASLIYFHHRN